MRWGAKDRVLLGFVTALLLFLATGIFSQGVQEKFKSASVYEDQAFQKLDKVKALIKNGSYLEAETLTREILNEVKTIHGVESLQVAQVLEVLIESILKRKKQVDDDSRDLIERVISIKKQVLGPEHAEVINCLNYFAQQLSMTGDYAEARDYLERALKIQEKELGSDHLDIACSLTDIGLLLKETGNLY